MNQPVPPDPSLRVIVSTFATQAAVALGQIANPATNETEVDLGRAKFNIDLVQVLRAYEHGHRVAEATRQILQILQDDQLGLEVQVAERFVENQ